MSKVVFMEHPELNKLLRRDDVFINLEEISILNTDIEEEGSGILVIYCKTEDSNIKVTSFLENERKYFTTDSDLIVRVILDENDVGNIVEQCNECCKCINCSIEYDELHETICTEGCKCVNCSV
jgi:hypothetical protein